MFTGIIEALGVIRTIEHDGSIMTLTVQSPISAELKPDQSVAHDGVCLTVVKSTQDTHTVQLVEETLRRTAFASIQTGVIVNLERAMPATGRFEGHVVQGHVDCVADFAGIEDGIHTFQFPEEYGIYLVGKGSVCLDGVSLTVAMLKDNLFGVALIPHTLAHTNLHTLQPGDRVNVEFDILAKYLYRWQSVQR